MASWDCSGIWRVLVVWSMFSCASLILTAPGVKALRFLKAPSGITVSYVGRNHDFDCTTDDPNATVSLWYSRGSVTWNEKHVTLNELALRGQVFTLLNLVLLDSGQYRCKATDQSGQTIQSSQVFLYVDAATLSGHFELIPDKAIFVLQGQNGTVTCECEGTSIATLKWEKRTSDKTSYVAVPNSWVTNIKDSSTNRVKAVLKITNAQVADSGVYKCTVSVKPGKSDFKLTHIQVKALTAPTIVPYKDETVIQEESTKVIECVAKGSPKPKVTWYRNDKILNTTNCVKDSKSCENVVYEVYEQGSHPVYTIQVLKIRSALYPRDIAEFKCVASNGVSPNDEIIINLDVQGSPKILEQKNLPVAKDSIEFSVSCQLVKGNPLPTFKWQYAFQNLECDISESNCYPSESQWKPIPPQLMTPASATPTNESIVKVDSHQPNTFYRCQAFNKFGNDSQVLRFVRLAKDEKPIEIDTANTRTEYNEKSTLHVYCIERGGGYLQVFFTKDGKKLLSGNVSRVNVTVEDKNMRESLLTLTVKNLTLNDTGNYGCTSESNYPKISSSINITIKSPAPPTIKRYGGENVIKEGSTKIVKCIAKGSPKPNVTWYRNNKQLSTKKSVNDPRSCKDFAYEVYEEGNDSSGVHTPYTIQVLKIRSVLDARHHEEFKCVASNGILPDAELIVNFHVPAELANHLKLRPANPIVVLQGQEAKVKCDSVGISAAKVQWKKQTNAGDVAVPDSTVTIVKDKSTNRTRAILEVKFAQKQDSGVYKCVLTAFGKSDFKLTTITVKESLAFLEKPPRVIQGYLGQSVEIDCSTNDGDAAVSLLQTPHPFASYKERKPKANKLSKKRQVFTILNLQIEDAGIYSCRATNRKNQTIQWPRFTGYFVLSRVRL